MCVACYFRKNLTDIPSSSTQILLVRNIPGGRTSQTTITACKFESGKWVNSLTTFQAVVGKNGISQMKLEGDNITPAGLWPIGEFFGWYPQWYSLLSRIIGILLM